MTAGASRTIRRLGILALAASLVGLAVLARDAHRVRQIGAGMVELLAAKPSSAAADAGPVLQAVGQHLSEGDIRAARDLLVLRKLSPTDEAAAQRFLASQDESRRQFVALAGEAQRREAAGGEATGVRRMLLAALAAAADEDVAALSDLLGMARQALDADVLGTSALRAGLGPEMVVARAWSLAPAVDLGRETLAESFAPAQRLIARAARRFADRDYGEAGFMLELAAQLLGVSAAGSPPATDPPEWFLSMAAATGENSGRDAKEVVQFCETVAQSQTLSPPVKLLVQRARRHREAGQDAEAGWWASVALQSLGMSDDAAAAAATEAQP